MRARTLLPIPILLLFFACPDASNTPTGFENGQLRWTIAAQNLLPAHLRSFRVQLTLTTPFADCAGAMTITPDTCVTTGEVQTASNLCSGVWTLIGGPL